MEIKQYTSKDFIVKKEIRKYFEPNGNKKKTHWAGGVVH
jgi:hypothetical protein